MVESQMILSWILLLVAFIPFIYLIINWKKSNLLLKFFIIIPFILILYLSWGFIVFSTPLYLPIYHEVNLSQDLSNRVLEFHARPILKEYLVAFETSSDKGCGGYKNGPWPESIKDLEIFVESEVEDKEYTVVLRDGRTYLAFNCGSSSFDFGKIVEFDNPFKNKKFIFHIKTNPPKYIQSLKLKLEHSGHDEFWAWSPLIYIEIFALAYGSILLYFTLIYLVIFVKHTTKKKSTRDYIEKRIIPFVISFLFIALFLMFITNLKKSSPSETDDEYAEKIINILLPDEDIYKILPSAKIKKADALGGKGSFLQYYQSFGIEAGVNVLIDRPDAIWLRHKITIGTDMANWELIKKETNWPEKKPFKRTYLLVQKRGEYGRMVGLAFYEGAMVEISIINSPVNHETIKNLEEVTWNVSKRLKDIYDLELKQIAEGPLFKDDPVITRPDLPDPDLK